MSESTQSKAVVNDTLIEARPAPSSATGPLRWLQDNLFGGWGNTLLTLLSLWLIWLVLPGALQWSLIDAVWTGGSDACRANPDGACWPFITQRWDQFLYGFYEESERWRVNLVLAGLFAGIAWLVWERAPARNLVGLFMLFGFPLLAYLFLYGVPALGLPVVSTDQWGGFMLTLVIALTGIVVSLPLGVVLALGRRSQMPVVRSLCIIFIEFWRGVPLITVLFMASVMFPLFLPDGVTVDQLLRAMVGVSLFASAYMAEVVRGGLQAISKGQYEGASSLGLGYWQSMRLVILPQALKIVIPGIVNTFIGLFKDTTLVLIIGLLDLLGMVQSALADAQWSIRSVPYTGYVFVGFVFWCSCYGMAIYSRRLEEKLNTGHSK
ncbi:amino acid ABC transporter permease [Granulosicoccaceae sp. 1_MG-2023]|nr:amino acid ABC transporter permease [Granulosicoccaceae sp. 1_MG-2023]